MNQKEIDLKEKQVQYEAIGKGIINYLLISRELSYTTAQMSLDYAKNHLAEHATLNVAVHPLGMVEGNNFEKVNEYESFSLKRTIDAICMDNCINGSTKEITSCDEVGLLTVKKILEIFGAEGYCIAGALDILELCKKAIIECTVVNTEYKI